MHSSSTERINHYGGFRTKWSSNPNRRYSSGHEYLKDKDLSLVPFHIAYGAQLLGYWVRSIIIWSKQISTQENRQGFSEVDSDVRTHMPEPVLDRPVVGHEYILLLARGQEYDYYMDRLEGSLARTNSSDRTPLNVRSVWSFRPVDAAGNHGARFPEELPRRCILLGSKAGDLIFDPFAGEGTTLRVAQALGRMYFGCDISPTYVRAAQAMLGRLPEIVRQPEEGLPLQPSLLPLDTEY
jgi:DNA modification methylase